MEIGFWLEYFLQRRAEREARNWPATEARVEHAAITIIPTKKTRWALEVAYAYRVNGEVYGNTERRFFTDPSVPRELEQTLKESGFSVRYDPQRPTRSFMELVAQESSAS